MKNLKYKSLVFIIIAIFFLLLNSCLGSKKTSEISSVIKERIEIEKLKDSIKTIIEKSKEIKETNAPIDKENFVSFKTADSLTNQRINDALRGFYFSEKSGGNSYSAKYDEATMQLIFKAFIAQTENNSKESSIDTNTSTNTDTKSEKSFEEQTDEYIYKKITKMPWWGWVIIAWFLRNQIIAFIGIFVPGVKRIKSIHDLLNQPNKQEDA